MAAVKLRDERQNGGKNVLSAVRTQNHFHLSCARYRRSYTSFAFTSNVRAHSTENINSFALIKCISNIILLDLWSRVAIIERSIVGRLAESERDACVSLTIGRTYACISTSTRAKII